MAGSQNKALVDVLLTNISNKIPLGGFIADELLPMVKVKQTTGLVGKYGSGSMRAISTHTIGKNNYNQVDTRNYSTDTYNIETHGLKDLITEADLKNVHEPFNADIDTVEELVDYLKISKEVSLAKSLGDTSVLTNNVTLSGSSRFTDKTNSDPLDVFKTARETIFDAVSTVPDTAVIPWKVYQVLRYHPKILESLGFVQNRTGALSQQELASALDVKRVLIPEANYNVAKEGQATSLTSIWGNNVIFCVAPTSAKKRQVSLGYRFQLNSSSRRVFKNSVVEPPNSTLVQVDDSYVQYIAYAEAGYLIKDAI